MATTRVFSGGRADLMGRKVNGMTVGDVASYSPKFRWYATCDRCGIQQTFNHEAITCGGAKCQSAGCGKEGLHDYAH